MDTKHTDLDPILTYLISVNLADFEDKYRGYLHILGVTESPAIRHLAIASTAVILEMAQLPSHVCQFIVGELNKQTDVELKDSFVSILNGTHLIISKGPSANIIVLIPTLRPVTEQPKYTITMTMYFVKSVWAQAADIMAGKA